LDAKCVSCHGENRKPGMPDLRRGDLRRNPYGFASSFCEFLSRSLVKYHTNVYKGANWAKRGRQSDDFVQASSLPGDSGARASRLYSILRGGHHGVKLTDEEMRRLVVFMDASGAYIAHDFDAGAQKDGKVVEPVPACAKKVCAGVTTLEGPWRVDFPTDTWFLMPCSVTMQTLLPWRLAFDDSRKSHSARTRYFSGTATYHAQFVAMPECAGMKMVLDLGRVETQAVVRINGKLAANLAKAPYRVGLTSFAKTGLNEIEIAVTSSDVNKRIYNAQLSVGERIGSTVPDVSPEAPLVDNGILGPVVIECQPDDQRSSSARAARSTSISSSVPIVMRSLSPVRGPLK
jgi:hypothetical protein